MTSTEKRFQLCFEACKAAAEWLNEAQDCAAYVVKRCGACEFVVYARLHENLISWESFTSVVQGLRLNAYFGILELQSRGRHVAFFVYYV